MAAHDQLELIAPSGEITFYDLDPSKGITNIGRHPENDIVIDSSTVAPFHAVLDHRQRPYQLVVVTQDNPTTVGGEPVQPNVPHVLHTWDTIELNGHSLVLVEGGGISRAPAAAPVRASAAPVAAGAVVAGTTAAVARPSAPAPAAAPTVLAGAPTTQLAGGFTRLSTPPPDRTDETIVTEITEREWIIDVEQMATTQLTIVNGGDLVATFFARVEGVDPNWVTIEPPHVNLFEGERATVSISITPPRRPDTSAGTRYVAVTVSSPDYPNHLSSLSGSLTINPYYDFTITDLAPRQQTVGWRRATGRVSYVVANRGNSDCTYRIDGDDDERGCRFEFRMPGQAAALIGHAELKLAPDASAAVPMLITPNKRRFFGVGKHNYMCTVTTTPLTGAQTPRAVLAQVASAPLIGPWVIVLVLILLALLIGLLLRPRIQNFGQDPLCRTAEPGPIGIKAGDSVTLYWCTSPFTSVRIDSSIPQDPEAGPANGSSGSKTFKPVDTVTYDLHAENFLTGLYQPWFSPDRKVSVEVTGILPGVSFTGTTTSGTIDSQTRTITIVRGASVTLLWTVARTDTLFLLTNGAPQSIAPDQFTGSMVVQPTADTTYKLQANNHYTPAGGFISDAINVHVVDPTATPPPDPLIQRFDVQPTVITAGESVQLDWVVTGADNVTISGVDGVLSPNGSLQVAPTTTGSVAFNLVAQNSAKKTVSMQRVITVNPAPTATAVPLAPTISFFTPNPSTVVADANTPAIISLSWSVSGATTLIKITGPDFGEVDNLAASGTITVSVTKPTLFVLTALNGPSLSASQTAQITVNAPTPTPTPPPTATPAPTPLPLPIIIFSAVSDPAHPELAGIVQQDTSPGIPSNTRQYTVTAGTFVLFSWTTTNAVKTSFNHIDKAPADSQSVQINTPATYPFAALNAASAEVDLFIRVVTVPRKPPDPPFGVTGVMTQSTGPVTLSWQYSTALLPRIDSFTIYRADVPTTTFVPIANNISKSTLPFQFVDTTGACNKVYYVVAVYTDTDGVQKETSPSTNSWYSPACH